MDLPTTFRRGAALAGTLLLLAAAPKPAAPTPPPRLVAADGAEIEVPVPMLKSVKIAGLGELLGSPVAGEKR